MEPGEVAKSVITLHVEDYTIEREFMVYVYADNRVVVFEIKDDGSMVFVGGMQHATVV